MKWVLIQGNGNYSIGTFDGTKFNEETGRHPCDVGPNFYATQTWANTETGDGRRIQTAWMRGAYFPNMPFNQEISFPCELSLHQTPAGLRIFRQPIKESALLHHGQDSWTNRTLNAGQVLPLEPSGRLFHLQAALSIPAGARLIFNLRGVPVILTSQTVESGNRPASVFDRVKSVEILMDRASIEAFANQGEVSSTRFVLPDENGLSLKAEGGDGHHPIAHRLPAQLGLERWSWRLEFVLLINSQPSSERRMIPVSPLPSARSAGFKFPHLEFKNGSPPPGILGF